MLCGRLYRTWGADVMLDVPWRLYAADAMAHLGDTVGAGALAQEHLRLARAFGAPRQTGLALRAAARTATTGSSALLGEAVAALESSPARLELARTLEQHAGALIRAGRSADGVDALRRAARLAAGCAAPALCERLDGLLVGSGSRPAEPLVSGPDALTPAERQVGGLAADGLTNRRIAEQLFVTEKTVETHLTRIYRKLNVHSRTQLAIYLAARRRAA
jgi:DNA-binding CsgD family transcriptional regulator